MKRVLTVLLLAGVAFGQGRTSSNILPSTNGLTLGNYDYRWKGWFTDLDVKGNLTCNGQSCVGSVVSNVDGQDITPKSIKVGATLMMGSIDPYSNFGLALQHYIDALPASGGIIDARGVSGTQALSANLTINKPNTQILLGNVNVNQGSYQVVVPSGTHNVRVVGMGGNASSTGTSFSYTGTSWAWVVGDSSADTNYFRFENINLYASDAAGSGLLLNRTWKTVLDHARIRLAVNGSGTQVMSDGTGSYSAFTQFNDPDFSGGHLGVVLAGTGLVANNSNQFIGGRINTSSKDDSGSICLDIQTGDSNAVMGTDLENCATGMHVASSNNVMPMVRMENVTTCATFDRSGNQVNMVAWPACPVTGNTGGNTVLGLGPRHYFNANGDVRIANSVDDNLLFALSSGITYPQSTIIQLGDSSTGSTLPVWWIFKDGSQNLEFVNKTTSKLRFQLAQTGEVDFNTEGENSFVFNYDNGANGNFNWYCGTTTRCAQISGTDGSILTNGTVDVNSGTLRVRNLTDNAAGIDIRAGNTADKAATVTFSDKAGATKFTISKNSSNYFSILDGSTSRLVLIPNGSTELHQAGDVRFNYADSTTGATKWYGGGSSAVASIDNAGKGVFAGGVAITTTTVKPTCAVGIRGTFWTTQGGAGVADVTEQCIKNAADGYEWKALW